MEETESTAPGPQQGRVAFPRTGAVLTRLTRDHASRKTFLKMAGGAGTVGAFGTLLAACGGEEGGGGGAETPEEPGEPASDEVVEVFNYALFLEYVEAQFYNDVLDAGVITDESIASILDAFGDHEQEHVDTLVAAVEQMGGEPAEDPEVDFTVVIEGGPREVLTTAAMIENLGAGAYLAEVPKLIGSDEALAAALSIHSVEARHAAALNDVTGLGFTAQEFAQGSVPDGAFAEPVDRARVMEAIQPFLVEGDSAPSGEPSGGQSGGGGGRSGGGESRDGSAGGDQ